MRRPQTKVPVVLPRALARIDADEHLEVTVDGSLVQVPESARPLRAGDLRDVVASIATELDCPVRVDVHQHGIEPFTDIITPTPPATAPAPTKAPVAAPSTSGPGRSGSAPFGFGLLGSGFLPGEQVCVAVVVSTQPADADGCASLRLPPALLTRAPGLLVLFGRTSGTIVVSDPHDETGSGAA